MEKVTALRGEEPNESPLIQAHGELYKHSTRELGVLEQHFWLYD